MEYQQWPDPIVKLDHPATGAEIRYVGDGFELHWTDYVVNDWTELYPTLALACARLALLMACADTDFELFFDTHERDFVASAQQFFRDNTR